MPRGRSPNRDKAKQMYISSNGSIKLVDIAEELNIKASQVRKWKSQDNWDGAEKGTLPNGNRSVTKQKERNTENKEVVAEEVKRVLDNPDLSDKQRLFCLHYIKCFNATKAYQKAYGCNYETAAAIGYRQLDKVGVREEIHRLKESRLNREFLSESDIFQKYMDIAFADMTDFVAFGRETVPVMTMYGPLEVKDEATGEKIKVTKEINTVRFREHTEVDGTLISEVKQGKDGASIKLPDKMKALDWIAEHMGMATEEQRARVDMLRSKIDSEKDVPIQITFRKASEKCGG